MPTNKRDMKNPPCDKCGKELKIGGDYTTGFFYCECEENKKEVEKHKHIWKYNSASNMRVCEAPFPFIKSCGKSEIYPEENTNPLCGNCHENHEGNTYCYGAKHIGFMPTKIEMKKEHKHNFILSQSTREAIGAEWLDFAYIICPECGEVRKVLIKK